MRTNWLGSVALICIVAATISCGGGGGSTGGTAPPPPPAPLAITTTSPLPGALQGHSYSTTLTAANGQGALHWSIAPISSTTLFVNGLTIDPSSGVLSGNANFGGTGGFTATVTDSASPAHTASAGFTLTAYQPLKSAQSQTVTLSEFQNPGLIDSIQGGFPPVNYTVTSGTIPPGLRFNHYGQLTGAAYATGSYQFTVTAQDSFSPPESATQSFTITITPPAFSPTIAYPTPAHLVINRPFIAKMITIGGVPPYKFAFWNGFPRPPWLSLDTSTGTLSGTPTALASYHVVVQATDSSATPQNATVTFDLTVAQPLGRNDTPATAILIDNGSYSASISPYIDPPNGAPFAADHDYYKLVSLGGATVHVETFAKRYNPHSPLDTVIEIVDGNGIRLNTCRQPGDTSTTFADSCINDDISASPHVQDSAIDFQVPGTHTATTTFYVHVFDWRGDARPDMIYGLQVSGVVAPLSINPISLAAAARGIPYFQQLSSKNGSGSISWSVVSGSLPPGLTLSSTGVITGVATTDGTYPFTVQASDSGTPPQVVSAQEQIQVGGPITITSPAIWPDACLNQPYSFTVQASGGVPPLRYVLLGGTWQSESFDQATGIFTGTSSVAANYQMTLVVTDASLNSTYQAVSLNVKQCP